MAMLNGTFDATQVEPSKPLEPVPTGDYVCMIEDSDLKTTKSGDGQFIELTMRILDGPFKGQPVWSRINLVSTKSSVAQRIGQEQFSALCHAVGVLQVNDTSQLHNRPFIAKVVYVPPKDQYQASNDVKGYKAIADGASMPATQAPAAQQTAPAAAAQPSWNINKKPAA